METPGFHHESFGDRMGAGLAHLAGAAGGAAA